MQQKLVFYNPTKLFIDQDPTIDLLNEIKNNNCKYVLITCGKSFLEKQTNKLQEIQSQLEQYGIKSQICNGIRANPEIKSVVTATNIILANEQIDAILSIGGGSVSDCSKAISAIAGTLRAQNVKQTNVDECWDFVEKRRNLEKSLKLFVLLTLSATGSEHDNVCVISNDEQRKKYGLTHQLLFPIASGVWLEIQENLPKFQQVNAFVDSQMHILECCFANNDYKSYKVVFDQDISYCKAIIQIGNQLLDNTVTDKEQRLQLRKQFAWICSSALDGICTAGTNGRYRILHQLEHAIAASIPTVSHGAGLGVIFSGYLRYCKENNERVIAMNDIGKQIFGAQDIDEFVTKYREMLKNWGHPTTMQELLKQEVTDEMIDEFADNFRMKSLAGFEGDDDQLRQAGKRIIQLSCF